MDERHPRKTGCEKPTCAWSSYIAANWAFGRFVIGRPVCVEVSRHRIGKDALFVGFDASQCLRGDICRRSLGHIDALEHVGVDGAGKDAEHL